MRRRHRFSLIPPPVPPRGEAPPTRPPHTLPVLGRKSSPYPPHQPTHWRRFRPSTGRVPPPHPLSFRLPPCVDDGVFTQHRERYSARDRLFLPLALGTPVPICPMLPTPAPLGAPLGLTAPRRVLHHVLFFHESPRARLRTRCCNTALYFAFLCEFYVVQHFFALVLRSELSTFFVSPRKWFRPILPQVSLLAS